MSIQEINASSRFGESIWLKLLIETLLQNKLSLL